MLFQYATVKEFVEPVEEITGRTVRSFISGLDSQEGVAAEMFVFYPRGEERMRQSVEQAREKCPDGKSRVLKQRREGQQNVFLLPRRVFYQQVREQKQVWR